MCIRDRFSGGVNLIFSKWIVAGEIGTELLRPMGLFALLGMRRMGEFFFSIIFQAIPVLIFGYFFLGGVGPASMMHLSLFFLSVIISVGIMFYVEMLFGMGCFYTLSYYALTYTKQALMEPVSYTHLDVYKRQVYLLQVDIMLVRYQSRLRMILIM